MPAAETAAGTQPVEGPSESERLDLADRLGGLVFQAQRGLQTDRLGSTFEALDRADELVFTPAWRERLAALRTAAENGLSAALRRVEDGVRTGHVPVAAVLLAQLRTPSHPHVDQALRRWSAERGWPAVPARVVASDAVPVPDALASGTVVGLTYGGEPTTGVVTSAVSSGEIGLRVQRQGDVAFVFVPRSHLEPIPPSPASSLDQARAALHAGEADLAALWLAHARSAGASAADVAPLAAALGPAGT